MKGNTNRIPLVRILANGAVDPTFQYTNGALDTNNNFGSTGSIVRTSDGGFLVGGFFNKYQGFVKKSIVKLDSNGVVEPQYFTTLGPDSADPFLFSSFPGLVSKIIPSKFGGYYVGGNFLKWDGQASQPLVKITGMNGGVPVGLNDASISTSRDENVVVYPNPTTGTFSIESVVGINRVEVYGLIGQVLQNVSFTSTVIHLNKIDLRNNPNGIYFLKIELTNGKVVKKKIVKY